MKNPLLTPGLAALMAACTLLPSALPASVPSQTAYQGRLLDDNVNFDGTGYFKFVLVTTEQVAGVTATATAVVNAGFITSYNVTNPGSGYVSPPTVTILGLGSGAQATADLSGDSVSGITAVSPGSGYSPTPTVLIAPPPPSLVETPVWSNDGTSATGALEPTAAVPLTVEQGLFSLGLGDTSLTGMTLALSASVFEDADVRLRVFFSEVPGGPFVALAPDVALLTVPYAFRAAEAETLAGTAVAVGQGTNATADGAFAAGNFTAAGNLGAAAFGTTTSAAGMNAFAIGANTFALGDDSFASGFLSFATGRGSTVFGERATASGDFAFAAGNNTTASDQAAVAFGEFTEASAENAFALGERTDATGQNSLAGGDSTLASGFNAVAFGTGTVAPSVDEVALGRYNTTYTLNSVNSRSTFDAADRAFSIGGGTSTSSRADLLSLFKDGSLVLSGPLTATELDAGRLNVGDVSADHVIATKVVIDGGMVSGDATLAGGAGSLASGDTAVALGRGALARSFAEIALGSFSTDYTPDSTSAFDVDDRALVVGGGTDSANRADLLTLFKDGSLVVSGPIAATALNADSLSVTDVSTDTVTASTFVSRNATAMGAGSTSLGSSSDASGDGSFAAGVSTTASSSGAAAFGQLTEASGLNSVAMGDQTAATGPQSLAVGTSTDATATNAMAGGDSSVAGGFNALAFGTGVVAPSLGEVALGTFNTTYALTDSNDSRSTFFPTDRAFSIGGGSSLQRLDLLSLMKSGDLFVLGHAEAASFTTPGSTVTGSLNLAVGDQVEVSGDGSVAMGFQTKATGPRSAAFGSLSEATGNSSFAVGNAVEASGDESVAMGVQTDAPGKASFAHGEQTTASGHRSLAMGLRTTAAGLNSVALGQDTTADGDGSLAHGDSSSAVGDSSLALGDHVSAFSYAEVAFGSFPTLYTADSTTAFDSDDRALVVGGGTSTADRQDLLSLNKGGDLSIARDLNVPGSATVEGQLIVGPGSNASSLLVGGDVFVGADSSSPTAPRRVYFSSALSNTAQSIGYDPGTSVLSVSTSLAPNSDASLQIGTPGARWLMVNSLHGVSTTSDARRKKDVLDLDYGLDAVMALRPVSFLWNNPQWGADRKLGLIAQEAEKVVPEVVNRSVDPGVDLGMNYPDLVPVLIKAVQEQQAQIQAQSERIEALERELAALR